MARIKPYPVLRKSVEHRKWLNPRKGSAHITWSVTPPTYNKNSYSKRHKHGSIDAPMAGISIADCSRKISLDFYGRNKEASLRKMDILIDELMAMRTALAGAYERREELKVIHPKAKVWND